MNLFLVRHAAAVERTSGVPEEWRYLTPEGRAFFRKTAKTVLKKGIEPNLIITSPLLRAVQTADILAETISHIGPLIVADELAPGFDMAALERLLDAYRSVDELVLVGHEPDLSRIIAALLSIEGGFNFKKGGVVKLKVDPAGLRRPATFKWLAVGRKVIDSAEEAFGVVNL